MHFLSLHISWLRRREKKRETDPEEGRDGRRETDLEEGRDGRRDILSGLHLALRSLTNLIQHIMEVMSLAVGDLLNLYDVW